MTWLALALLVACRIGIFLAFGFAAMTELFAPVVFVIFREPAWPRNPMSFSRQSLSLIIYLAFSAAAPLSCRSCQRRTPNEGRGNSPKRGRKPPPTLALPHRILSYCSWASLFPLRCHYVASSIGPTLFARHDTKIGRHLFLVLRRNKQFIANRTRDRTSFRILFHCGA